MTTNVERRLRALRDDLPEPPAGIDLAAASMLPIPVDVAAGPRSDGHRRLRWVVAATVVAVLVLGVTVAVDLVRRGGPDRGDASGGLSSTRVDPATQVFDDGDRVEGTGEVLAVQGQPVRFCGPEYSDLQVPLTGHDPLATCHHAVTVTGVDLGTLTGRQSFPADPSSAAWISGTAHLVGTYRDGALADVTQTPDPGYADPASAVPCAAPAGGWPRGPADANPDLGAISAYRDAHPGAIQTVAGLRPSATQLVLYVLAVGDPGPVDAGLREVYDGPVCVVHSEVTDAELDAAAAVFDLSGSLGRKAGAYLLAAHDLAADGQPVVTVGVPRVTDALVVAARQLPPGLVQFEPWLSPVA